MLQKNTSKIRLIRSTDCLRSIIDATTKGRDCCIKHVGTAPRAGRWAAQRCSSSWRLYVISGSAIEPFWRYDEDSLNFSFCSKYSTYKQKLINKFPVRIMVCVRMWQYPTFFLSRNNWKVFFCVILRHLCTNKHWQHWM